MGAAGHPADGCDQTYRPGSASVGIMEWVGVRLTDWRHIQRYVTRWAAYPRFCATYPTRHCHQTWVGPGTSRMSSAVLRSRP